jgi:N-acetylglutamate synthase
VSPSIQIREFQYPEDYQAAFNLWESMEYGVRVGRSDSPEEIQKKVHRDPDLFLVAEAGNEIVGTVIGGFDGRRGTIYHLAVAKGFRKQGIGAQLMAEVESRLRAKGCVRCFLFVLVDNDEAAHFYEQNGWILADHLHPYAKDLIG